MAEGDLTLFEEWRAIPGYSHYEASNLGRIRSLDRSIERLSRHGTMAIYRLTGKILALSGPHKGTPYLYASLGKRKRVSAHVAVALAFHGERPAGHIVAHRDGVHTNNISNNLRWTVPGDNAEDDGRNLRESHQLNEIESNKRRLLRSEISEIRNLCKNGEWGIQTRLA